MNRHVLVGRESELAAVLAVCAAATEGSGSVLVVEGEPGIGKTALLEVAGSSGSPWRLLRTAGVQAESTVAFATLQGLLWSLREEVDELEPSQATLLEGLLELGPVATTSTFAVGAAVLGLLSIASRERAVVATVDDAQWADIASQEVLAFVGRRLEHERVALLVGAREGEPSLLGAERSFARLELGRLEPAAARSLLERSAPGVLEPDVAARLIEACAGNPLGLVELPLLLTDAQRAGVEPLPTALAAGPLVQRAFAARVAALGPDAQAALLLLAAAADEEPALEAMDRSARAGLADAEAAGLVVRGTGVDFRHPLMRAAVYGAASPSERRAAHRRLAAVAAGPRRAWHLAEAADEPDEAVAEALAAAGAEARLGGGVAAEAQALERAAELSPDTDRRALRFLGAARAWRLAGRIERADELLTRALPMARSPRTRAQVQLERGLNLLRAQAYREAYELLVAEARQAEGTEPDLAARLSAALALVANVYPDGESALVPAARALELAGTAGDEVELEALFAGVTARMSRSRPPEPEDERLVLRAGELLEQAELRTGEQPHWIAYALTELEHDDHARRLSDLSLAEARRAGDVWSLCYGLYARAVSEVVVGRVDAARAWVAEALPLAEEIGERWRLEQAAVVETEVEAARGNIAHCAGVSAPGDHNLGRALLAVGRCAEAVEPLEAAADAFSRQKVRAWYRLVPLDLAEAYFYAGSRQDAEALLREVAPAIESCPLARPRARLARVRGLLATEGKVDDAFAQALRLLEEVPQHLERARVELCWGERLRASGRSADAIKHLERALARFESLGAVGWAERARHELEAASGTARPPVERRTDVLTAQELRVARHAAGGMRDREIAAELFLSPRTVESYLHSAYRKLGVSNRTQLVGVLAAEGIRPPAPGAGSP